VLWNPIVLNRIGLALGVLGVVLIFIWGPPQPDLSEGVGLGAEGPWVDEHDRVIQKKRGRHKVLSRIGLGLIGLGFLAQFWSHSGSSAVGDRKSTVR
jgi:hypothetical protein